MSRGQTPAAFVAAVLTEAVDALQQGRSPTEHLAARLSHRVGADLYAVATLDLHGDDSSLDTWPSLPAPGRVRVLDHARRLPDAHPVLRHWRGGHCDVACVSRLVTHDRATWQASPTFALLRREAGATEAMGLRLDPGAPVLEAVGFLRATDFTDDEIELAELLRPPAVSLARHARHVARWRRAVPDVDERAAELGLTMRELEVLQLLAEGLLATTIAGRMSISPRTVHRHLGNIYSKLGTHDRLSTVLLATSCHLVLPRPTRTAVPCRAATPAG
jgi:DNA-binding CsgD family transcriptional regulator